MRLFLSFIIFPMLLVANIDLNSASKDKLSGLPLSESQIDDIYSFINQRNGIETIYELLDIESLTIEDINRLKRVSKVCVLGRGDF